MLLDYGAIDEQVKREFACDHATVAPRILIASNGVKHYRRQCTRCGRNLGSVKFSALSLAEQKSLTAFDPDLARRWYERRWKRYEELRQAVRERAECESQAERERDAREWQARYEEYIQSADWKRRRAKILKRDGGVCRGCLSRPATQVHHLTYERLGREMAWDLIAVCAKCHRAVHNAELPADAR